MFLNSVWSFILPEFTSCIRKLWETWDLESRLRIMPLRTVSWPAHSSTCTFIICSLKCVILKMLIRGMMLKWHVLQTGLVTCWKAPPRNFQCASCYAEGRAEDCDSSSRHRNIPLLGEQSG